MKKSIEEIFQDNGEVYFRKLESKIVDEIYKNNNHCISTGGGMVKNPDNIEKLKQNGFVIFLNKDPEAIAKKNIYGRPLVKNGL